MLCPLEFESNAMIRQTMQHVLRAGAEGSPQTNPIIARIERNSSHCCGRSTQKIVCSLAPCFPCFLVHGPLN